MLASAPPLLEGYPDINYVRPLVQHPWPEDTVVAGPATNFQVDQTQTDVVLLIPGIDTSRLGHTLDLLVDNLDRHLRGKPGISDIRITSRQGEGVGQALIAFRLDHGSQRRIELRELGWTDIRPSVGDASIYARLIRGTILIRYWIGSWFFKTVPATSRAMRRSILISCLLLAGWYALVLVAALHLFLTDYDLLSLWGASQPTTLPWKILWVVILGLLGSEMMIKGLNNSWSAYAFMTDKDSFRRRTKTRLLGMLAHITEQTPPGGRIVVLAHSMGTLVAVDALESAPDDLPAVDLITLGSPLEFLALREPGMFAAVQRCVASKLIRTWSDYFDERDTYCSRIPVLRADAGKFTAHSITLRRPIGEAWGMRDLHNAYLRRPEVLDEVTRLP